MNTYTNIWTISSLLLQLSTNYDCAKSADIETTSYQISLNDWNTLKIENNNCYTYTSSFQSWTGFGSITTIKIEDGIVITRSYEAIDSMGSVTDSYHETTPDEIGTNSKGEPAITIDELYEDCDEYLALANPEDSVYFNTFDDNNILKLCGYVPNLCMDDCFKGVKISSLVFCGDEEESEELPPIASADYYLTTQNSPVMIDVLANDIDPDQPGLSGKETLIIKEFTNGDKGSVELDEEEGYGKLKYSPNLDECGDDQFAYTIQDDDQGFTDIGTVHVYILCIPSAVAGTTDIDTTTATPDDAYSLYEVSLNDWNTLKIENNDCYTYISSLESWTGYRSTTTIKVENGVVVRRSYEAFDGRPAPIPIDGEVSDPIPVESYDETEADEIGTNSAGAEALTMDELYFECYDDLEMANPADTVYFTTFDDNNILKTCGYVPDRCMDDCFIGTRLSSFEFCGDEEEELPPIANPDITITTMNSPVLIDVLENDIDPDQPGLSGKETLIITEITNGNKGSVELMNNQLLGYSPNLNECGDDQFTYTIKDDDQGFTAIGTVHVYIACPMNL